MKFKSRRFSVQFLILILVFKTISGGFVQAQPHPSDDGAIQKQPETPSQLGPGTELPFRISGGYLILVEGAIGTRTHHELRLEPGASMYVVDSKMAHDFELRREPAQSVNVDRKLDWDEE